jgi:hypothetical protein
MRKDINWRGLSRNTEVDGSTPAFDGWGWTTSTFTKSIDGTTTPIEETLEVLHDVVKAGKARYIGASSMFAWPFCKALHLRRVRVQAEWKSVADSIATFFLRRVLSKTCPSKLAFRHPIRSNLRPHLSIGRRHDAAPPDPLAMNTCPLLQVLPASAAAVVSPAETSK